jgi:hypothetical protein
MNILDVLKLVLFTVFLTLKLVGVIDWSWWWVTCPLWGMFVIGLFIGYIEALCKPSEFNRW